jgi:hypothetical protein
MSSKYAILLAALAFAACSKSQPADRPAGVGPSAPGQPAPAPPPLPPAAPAPMPEQPAAAPDPSRSISGTITLPQARKGNVAKGDTIFIIARRAGGPPGPGSMLAVKKVQAGDFPMPFTIGAENAMIPGIPFDGAVSITVRVDKDGDAMTRRKGDVLGQANDVKVGGHDVTIPLDTVQAEDVTLGGGPGGPGGPPPGLPPGHP